MITITIEGPQGSGKTRIGKAIYEAIDSLGLNIKHKEEITDAALIKFKNKIDILIIEKQS